ncbi:MAG TPA: hypothetical protein VGG54_27890 [Trebonia sp.]
MTRYLSGLCVAGLGLCGGGWLIVATEAFGGADAGGAGRVNLATGAGLILASCVAMIAWAVAWRRRMRMDGVLGRRFLLVSRREARRNRRELARDIRRATRLARRASRQARRGARRPARLADGEAPVETSVNGATGHGNSRNGHAFNGHAFNGHAFNGHAFNGHAFNGHAQTAVGWSASGPCGNGLNGYGAGAHHEGAHHEGAHFGGAHFGGAHFGGGHDSAGVADVLGELRTLRTLLGPLVATTSHVPVLQARAPHPPSSHPPSSHPPAAHRPAAQPRSERPEWPPPGAGLLAGDDELLRLADSEEAWW